MRRVKAPGFTLIEVTLAIVIGIIMIAGATLIYNQAKTSAGNGRAQAKVVGLQQLIEEYAAQNQGIYPPSLNDVNALWTRKRPDDWNKSPWGGLLGGTTANASYLNPLPGVGVSSLTGVGPATLTFTGTSLVRLADPQLAGLTTPSNANVDYVGGLVYDYDGINATFSYPLDIVTNGRVNVKGYAVYICDQQGRLPNFVTGGKAN